MSKGKKGKRNYEKEIQDAYERMKKYPEYLRSARNSDVWIDFLINIGVNPDTIESDKGSAFWEKVRTKAKGREPVFIPTFSERDLVMARAEIAFTVYRDANGRFTKQVTDKPFIVYRDIETKQFKSYKKIQSLE